MRSISVWGSITGHSSLESHIEVHRLPHAMIEKCTEAILRAFFPSLKATAEVPFVRNMKDG